MQRTARRSPPRSKPASARRVLCEMANSPVHFRSAAMRHQPSAHAINASGVISDDITRRLAG